MAYNLGNLWRRLVLPKRIDNWSLTSLQQRLMKTGGRLVKHARYYWLLLAESPFNAAAVPGDGGKDCRLTSDERLDTGCWQAKSQREGGGGRRGLHGIG